MNIILSPHFDDAVLSLGGLLAKEGGDTIVATFFAGAPTEPTVTQRDIRWGFTDSTETLRERTAEDKRSLNYLGVPDHNIRMYAHIDSQYRLPNHKKNDPYIPEPALEAAIASEIIALINETSPAPVKVFIPGFSLHTDHAAVKRAALAAIRTIAADSPVEFFFYQDLPYAAHIMDREYPRTIGNLFTRIRGSKRDYSILERNVTDGSLSVLPTVIPLEKAELRKKLEGISLYRSQVDHLGKHLLKRIERFAKAQAQSRSLSAPYCEVVYKIVNDQDHSM